jgi:hypothetical protein
MNRKAKYLGLGIAIGAGIGAALGAGLHQMGAWLPIGIGVGMAIAIGAFDRARPVSVPTRLQKSTTNKLRANS